MTAAMILELIALGVKLEPTLLQWLNNMFAIFQDKTPEECQAMLDSLKATLQPMQVKP